jgi:hypothetical protein
MLMGRETTPSCHLHLGIHKTGSTYLQNLWALQLARHPRPHYIPLKKLRSTLTAAVRPRAARDPGSSITLDNLAACRSWLQSKFARYDSLLLSDENLLGTPYRFDDQMGAYPQASESLRTLFGLLPPNTNVSIYVCLRSYGDWIESSYLQYLKNTQTLPFADYLDRINLDSLTWVSLLQRILRVAPEANVIAWSYESFRADNSAVLSALNSLLGAPPQPLPAKQSNPSLSKVAQSIIVSAGQAGIRKEHTKLLLAFCKQHLSVANDYPAAKLMNPALRTLLDDRYKTDLLQLRSLPRMRFLTSPS